VEQADGKQQRKYFFHGTNLIRWVKFSNYISNKLILAHKCYNAGSMG
jgi:hypothetical protein